MASPAGQETLLPPKDLSHHYSRTTRKREASKIKAFYKYFQIPGIGNLAGGLPNSSYFPYDTLEASAALPNRFKPTPNKDVDPPPTTSSDKKLSNPTPAHIVVPHDSSQPSVLRKIDLSTALQYGQAQGYPALFAFIREFATTRLHPNIPYKDGAEIVLTCGNTDGFSKTIECFTNPWDADRDWIREREGLLCEEYAYMGAIQTAKPRGINIVPLKVDAEGMTAYGKGGLLDVLENWDKTKGKRPHIMYTVTMGQNPTSGLLSVKRRKDIYAICSKYDIIIVEDDPYFFIQFPHAANDFAMKHRGTPVSMNHYSESNLNYQTSLRPGAKSSGSAFLDSLVPSYLSLDVDGRVVRLDTFSKTVAPGCRLGWLTGQPAIVERILRIAETSTQQPSGFVQSLIAELLIGPDDNDHDKASKPRKGETTALGWKQDGWIRWLEGLRGNYQRRAETMCTILEQGKYTTTDTPSLHRLSITSDSSDGDTFTHISKTQMYSFVPPMAGMFIWLKMDYPTHPLASSFTGPRLAQAFWVFQTREPYKILSAPGTIFAPTDAVREESAWQFFRVCFAAVAEEDVKDDSERFVSAARDFWEIKDKKVIEQLLEEADGNDRASEVESAEERMGRMHALAENERQQRGVGRWVGVNPALF